EITGGYEVSRTTALGRTTLYRFEEATDGSRTRTAVFADGTSQTATTDPAATTAITLSHGTTLVIEPTPDPRFGFAAASAGTVTVTTPAGLTRVATRTRTVSLVDSTDVFSITTLTDTTDINGNTYTSTYDGTTGVFSDTTPEGRQKTRTIDALGRVVEEQTAGLLPVTYEYDSNGRLSTVTTGTRSIGFAYDAGSRLSTLTDSLGRSWSFAYDNADRLTLQTLPDGRFIGYEYDSNGNLTTITPPNGSPHRFTYSPVGLQEDYVPPQPDPQSPVSNLRTTYEYDLDRKITRVIRPDGRTIDFGYDSAGRLSTMTLPRGSIQYSYDAATGLLATVTAPDGGTIALSFDGFLPTMETWANGLVTGNVSRTYDNFFRISTISVNGTDQIDYGYDKDGLLIQLGTLVLTRDPQNGLLTGSALGAVSDVTTYTSYGEIATYVANYNGSDIYRAEYQRDDLGRITEKTETVLGESHHYQYAYDVAGRLADVTEDGSTIAQYAYDDNGNRLSRTSPGGNTMAGAYDEQDRLLSYAPYTYTYTLSGELATKTNTATQETTTYEYDVLGNLLAVVLPDGTRIDYVLDGRNRRIAKKVNGTLIQGWLYQDDLNPIAELDGGGNVVSRFVYGTRENVPDFMIRSGEIYRFVVDHLGSPRLIVNTTTGDVAQRLDYDEFGNVTGDTNPGFQPFGFAGGLYDSDTGLTRFGDRDYDGFTGRWTSKDPIGFRGGDTNLYGYVLGDPVNWKDPVGHSGHGKHLCEKWLPRLIPNTHDPLWAPLGPDHPKSKVDQIFGTILSPIWVGPAAIWCYALNGLPEEITVLPGAFEDFARTDVQQLMAPARRPLRPPRLPAPTVPSTRPQMPSLPPWMPMPSCR
ncbi:MAG: RHS repeat protein, partial [Candidatus Dadabacteria bacterium]